MPAMPPVKLHIPDTLSASRGFTVVELVIVIVLVSIVAVFAIARFLDVGTFDPAVVRDQTVSMIRSAQQKAIGRSDVVLRIEREAQRLRISVVDDTGVVQTASMPAANVTVLADANQTGSCLSPLPAAEITETAPLEMAFDRLGDLLYLKAGNPEVETEVETAVRLCINSDTANSVCVSPAGFAYTGACIE